VEIFLAAQAVFSLAHAFLFVDQINRHSAGREENKMKNLLLTAALALLAATAASAQSVNVKATVPFSFIVNRATLPAGQYMLKSVDVDGKAVAIRNLTSNTSNLILSNACESLKTSGTTKLIFHRYAGRYFLSQIWMQGNNRGREIPPGAREKEIARDYSMEEVVLLASR
jgi:hypothetical protein